jgi:monoamine oxidase
MSEIFRPTMTKRDLLAMIGKTAGASAMYLAMSSLGEAQASTFKGPIKLDGDVKGTSVLILGAGVAGLVAALELSRAGYKVQVLEYNNRVGGRSWTLKGGDTFTELGGFTQHCEFAPGNYINPGPWRIPYHHTGLMHYCTSLGVQLEPFMQVNTNAYLHNTKAFGGKPQRFREINADYTGHVAELLAKAVNKQALSEAVSKDDAEVLLASLKSFGALDKDYRYIAGHLFGSARLEEVSGRRPHRRSRTFRADDAGNRAAFGPVDGRGRGHGDRTPERDLPAGGRHGAGGQGL